MFLDKIAAWSTPDAAFSDPAPLKPRISVERAVCPDSLRLPPVTASALAADVDSRIIVRLRHLTAAEAQPAQFHPFASDGLFRSNLFNEDDAQDAAPRGLPDSTRLEEVRARYVIGCDGARSWVRKALHYKLVGDSADFFWGVGTPNSAMSRRSSLTCHPQWTVSPSQTCAHASLNFEELTSSCRQSRHSDALRSPFSRQWGNASIDVLA